MQAVVKKILPLLQDERPDRQYAAAIVLAERCHAFKLLTSLDRSGLGEEEGHCKALVFGSQTIDSKKNLGRACRFTDPVLRQIVALMDRGYPVAQKLRRERNLTPEDYFFIGFNFVESHDEDEKEFGGELLSYLVEKSPRSKLGRSAKNKLRLAGLSS